MRTYDLTPFYRSTVGFDRLFSLLDQANADGGNGYPPYNIERTGENDYRISVAVSGFAKEELSIVAKENTLNGEIESRRSVLLRYYHLFNVEQCEGLESTCVDGWKPIDPINECEALANRMPNRPQIERNSRAFTLLLCKCLMGGKYLPTAARLLFFAVVDQMRDPSRRPVQQGRGRHPRWRCSRPARPR